VSWTLPCTVRELSDQARIGRFVDAVGRAVHRPLRLYLVGGTAIVDLGLRPTTLDVDITAESDDPAAVEELEGAIPSLKERLRVNVEWADPTQFLPIPRLAALERSTWRRSVGTVQVYHFDYRATALGKIGRGTEKDFEDVVLLVEHGIVAWSDVEQLWLEVRERPFGRAKQSVAEVELHMAAARGRLRAAGLAGA
jgi:hypothetical protein